jgi:hypothetical protein
MLDVYAAVGTVIARKVGAEPVSLVGIRRYLEAHEIDTAIFHDREAARAAGYDDVIAPWSMLLTMAMSPYWSPGDPPRTETMLPPFAWGAVALPGGEMMTNSVEIEHFAPLNLGDIVHSEYKIVKVTPKRTRVGDGDFVDFEVTFRNQHGVLLAIERTSVYRYIPLEEEGTSHERRSE